MPGVDAEAIFDRHLRLLYDVSMLSAVLVISLARVSQLVPQATNYHLDYELEQTGTSDRAGTDINETGSLKHELGLRDGMERYTYTYKHSKTDGKSIYIVLTKDEKANEFSFTRVFGDDRKVQTGKDVYAKQLATVRHFEFDSGYPVESAPEMQKIIAGIPCIREETWNVNFNDFGSSKCVYWYPIDPKKAKRVGWLEAEMYKKPRDGTAFKLAIHVVTTKIRFGTITPAEGG
jgi:hypothetical protein